ncbi:MAG: ankyrin repeat domain-containing protein [Candidatus Thorarchaeota archaeon]
MEETNKLLLQAAKEGNLEAVKTSLKNGADINFKDEDFKQSALHLAASGGHIEVVRFLIDNGADLLQMDGVDMTPLHLAARDGWTSIVILILNKAEEIPERILNDVIHVGSMSVYGRPEIVQILEDFRVAQVKPSISGHDEADKNLLESAEVGDFEGVKKALDDGANPKAVDGRGMKSIHWAALRGHYEIVSILLDRGADVNSSNSADWTPIMHASMEGYFEIVELLIQNGANVNAKTYVSGTALMFASGKGHKKIVELLLESGADSSIEIEGTNEEDGMTASLYAQREGHTEIVRILQQASSQLKGHKQ